ncbi:MAG: hypothetical protein ACKPKO_53210, partial [Candidatus Fonsibacter sp.]
RQPTQVLRAVNRRQFVPNPASLVDSRTDDDYQDINYEIDSHRIESNEALLERIRAMGDEASSSISSSHDVGSGLTHLSRSDSVRRVLATPEGFRHAVPSSSGGLTPGPEPKAMTDTDLDWEIYLYGILYGERIRGNII